MNRKYSIKTWRNIAGMSQEEVARELEVSRQTIVNWEKEGAKPSKIVLNALAQLYGTEPENIKEQEG